MWGRLRRDGVVWCFLLILSLVLGGFQSPEHGLLLAVQASAGDREPAYQRCVSTCERQPDRPPCSMGWALYSCQAQCRYSCMHTVTADRRARGEPILQYHGKWPFHRVLGVQELASTLFSIGNWAAHLAGYRALLRVGPSRWRTRYLWIARVALNSWIWSAVFHTRDVEWTERMDYFSAMASIGTGTVVAIVRVFGLGRRAERLLLLVATGYLAGHVTYLTAWRFDYAYNMLACIVVGVSSYLVWGWWYAHQGRRRAYGWRILAVCLAMTLAMCLELLDFPPWALLVDAHSLWHLSTCFIIPHYYAFLVADARFEAALVGTAPP